MNKTISILSVICASAISINANAQTIEEINCKNIEVSLDELGTSKIEPLDLLLRDNDQHSYDNFEFTLSKLDFHCGDLGDNTVRLTGTLEDGTFLRCEGIVKVNDLISPVALCKDVVLDSPLTVDVTSDMIDNGSFDNCSLDFDLTKLGTEESETEIKDTFSMKVTDGKGNTSECISEVTTRLDIIVQEEEDEINMDAHVSDIFNISRESNETQMEFDNSKKTINTADDIDPNTLSVYPNPAIDHVTFASKNSQLIFSGLIKDSSGVVLKTFSQFGSTDKLSLAGIESGVYLLEIKSQNTTVKTLRLIVK